MGVFAGKKRKSRCRIRQVLLASSAAGSIAQLDVLRYRADFWTVVLVAEIVLHFEDKVD